MEGNASYNYMDDRGTSSKNKDFKLMSKFDFCKYLATIILGLILGAGIAVLVLFCGFDFHGAEEQVDQGNISINFIHNFSHLIKVSRLL